jgi:hypothetical protein
MQGSIMEVRVDDAGGAEVNNYTSPIPRTLSFSFAVAAAVVLSNAARFSCLQINLKLNNIYHLY